MMQAYPLDCPQLLFRDDRVPADDSKPFSYLFINLILIDIRSTFPSLLSRLNSSEYPAISKRLSSAFDVVLSFIGFLIRTLDDDDLNVSERKLTMPPDLLLKVRKNVAETMSLTIEYLRDRWDASVAGAAGLHPSARHGTSATSEGTRLTLTWDSINGNVTTDPLILASMRTLAIWLREDENESLRKEAAGLMDMLLELYQASTSSVVDFRYAVLSALEVILTTEDGIDGFLAQNGWETLSNDLIAAVCGTDAAKNSSNNNGVERGQLTVRVLLVVVDSESTTEPRESWMEVVKSAASMKPSSSKDLLMLDVQIAVLQLAAALLTSSSKGMQKRYVMYTTGILGLANQLRNEARKLKGQEREEVCEELSDVIMSLENLR